MSPAHSLTHDESSFKSPASLAHFKEGEVGGEIGVMRVGDGGAGVRAYF